MASTDPGDDATSRLSEKKPPAESAGKQSFEATAFMPALSDLVQYRDPETGKTWCGFGRPPNWIRGKDRNQFRVQ